MSVQTISTKKFSQMSRHFNGIVSVSESNLKPSSSEIYNQPPACLSISSHLNNRRTCRRGQTRRTWGQGEGGYEKMPPDNFQEFLALFKTGTAPSPTPLLKLLMMMSVLTHTHLHTLGSCVALYLSLTHSLSISHFQRAYSSQEIQPH